MSIHVLRLGHRPSRDKRVTTHLLLAARAFGASAATYTGSKDSSLEGSIKSVVTEWGGDFQLEFSSSWKKTVKRWEGKVIHLTMYGVPFQEVINEIRENTEDNMIIVGGAKVPGELYDMVDRNIAVTSQPHSEVSALAVFLHEYYEGNELNKDFKSAKLRILPQEHGKLVAERDKRV